MQAKLSKHGGGGGSLPEDIIFDVLTRLPAKVLCRFRCVCKGWRALISGEDFIAAQKSRAAPLIAGVFRSQHNVHKFDLRVMDMDGTVLWVFKDVSRFLLPTRLDLICVYKIHGGATIIDPAAGRVSTVGEHSPSTPIPLSMTMRHRHYIFGRAAPSGAYKILRIHGRFQHGSHGQQHCDIATINDGGCGAEPAWRQRPAPPFNTDWYSGFKATVNGVLYFMPARDTGDAPHGRRHRIASFNLESEEWMETIDGPATGIAGNNDREACPISLAELKATLSMVQVVRCPFAYQIWLLIDSKKSIWVKQYTIQMPKNLFPFKALDVHKDGRILLLNQKIKENGFCYQYILQFYNPSTKSFTDVMEMAAEFGGALAFYTGSLLSCQITVDGLGHLTKGR